MQQASKTFAQDRNFRSRKLFTNYHQSMPLRLHVIDWDSESAMNVGGIHDPYNDEREFLLDPGAGYLEKRARMQSFLRARFWQPVRSQLTNARFRLSGSDSYYELMEEASPQANLQERFDAEWKVRQEKKKLVARLAAKWSKLFKKL